MRIDASPLARGVPVTRAMWTETLLEPDSCRGGKFPDPPVGSLRRQARLLLKRYTVDVESGVLFREFPRNGQFLRAGRDERRRR